MQLKLYPATLTKAQFEAGAASLCDLPYAITPRVSQTINGDWSLSFQYPANGGTGAELMTLDMLVRADGQLYRIEDLERGSDRNGNRHTVRAVHLMYDLRNRAIENIETSELTPGGVNQEIALEQVLNGSAFSAGTVDTDIVLDYLDILQKDVMWAIKEQILPQWGGELLPNNWVINIRKAMGADRGVHLRYGKNIKGVRYSESLDGVVTRLHILGYQDANIESINGGLDYIDSANIGLWANPREDYVTFPDDDLPEDLLSKGTAYLATVDTPRITLSVDLAQVRTSAQYAHYIDLERVELGDTVTVYHKDLGINITARVQSRSYNPVTGENERVELGNDDRNLYTAIASAQQAAEVVKMITDRNSHVRGEKLRGVVDLMTTQLMASGSFSDAQVVEGRGALFENLDEASPDYGALYIGPGILAIANTKDEAGSWAWRTFGTGQGFVADEIIAGTLRADLIRILGTEQFYWDADNIRITDQEDPLREMRIGRYDGTNYGIGLTLDGGITWRGVYGFDGLNLSFTTIQKENVVGLDTDLQGLNEGLSSVEGEVTGLSDAVTNLQTTNITRDNYIRTGALYTGPDGRVRYGMAIGEMLTQVVDEHGHQTIKKETLSQTFTSERQSFWQNGEEVAYFANNKLYVKDISAISSISIGNWLIDVENGFTIS